MAKDITEQEYAAEVTGLADEALDLSEGEDNMDLYDAVHELVDGHQWVIYTAYHFDVLKHARDAGDDAIEDHLEAIKGAENWRQMLKIATYAALQGDVLDRVSRR